MSLSSILLCPKCNGRLYDQVGNGREVLICSECKYQRIVNVEPEVEKPIAPNNYNKPKVRTDSPRLPVRDYVGVGEIDFTTEIRRKHGLNLVFEKTGRKTIPGYSTKPVEDVIISPKLRSSIKREIPCLYEYQEDAIRRINEGEHLVITAPTASGKTKAFLIPILDKILQNPNRGKISALFIYPNKALAADQVYNIHDIASGCGVRIKQLDGSKQDPAYRRQLLSDPPEILATNFDFISYHLAHSTTMEMSRRFREAIGEIKFIVVDEVHQCTGIFGANIKWVLRRLKRLNPELQFIASSATLEDVVGFCDRLFPVSMTHVEGFGKQTEPTLQFVSTDHERDLLIDLTREFALRGRQVLTFAKSRREAELIAIDGSDEMLEIFVHRSGIPEQRRAFVESALRRDEIKAVACTPTLELGINIGNLDAVVSSYTPYSRLVQRMGRAGRHGQDSNAVLVLDKTNPIAHYYASNQNQYFEDGKLHSISFENPTVQENQVLLMATESPLLESEVSEFARIVESLCSAGKLAYDEGRYYCTELGRKSIEGYGIRDIGYQVQLYTGSHLTGRRSFGKVESPLAYGWLYPGALYFHDKVTYRCLSFEKRGRHSKAFLIPEKTANITIPVKLRNVDVKDVFASQRHGVLCSIYGAVHVHQNIAKYYEKKRCAPMKDSVLHVMEHPLCFDFDTLGVVFGIGSGEGANSLCLTDSPAGSDGDLHAVKHLLIHAARMIVGAESNEMDGMVDSVKNTILLYDSSVNGGNGVSKAIFERQGLVVERACKIISRCGCSIKEGCPRCTHLEGCSCQNKNLNKIQARKILESWASSIFFDRGVQDYRHTKPVTTSTPKNGRGHASGRAGSRSVCALKRKILGCHGEL